MQRKRSIILCLLVSLTISHFLLAQERETIAERLGYSKNARLLIVHANDLGVTHSENNASISALEKGNINSAAIMVPCPCFRRLQVMPRNILRLTGPSSHYYFRMEILQMGRRSRFAVHTRAHQ